MAFIFGARGFQEQSRTIDGGFIFITIVVFTAAIILHRRGLDEGLQPGALGGELQQVGGAAVVQLVQVLRRDHLPLDDRCREHLLGHPQDLLVRVCYVIKGRPRLVEVVEVYLLRGDILLHIAGVLLGEAILWIVGMHWLRVRNLLLFEGIWAVVMHIRGPNLEGVLGLEGLEGRGLEQAAVVVVEAHRLQDVDALAVVLPIVLAGEGRRHLVLVVVYALIKHMLSNFVGIGGRGGHHE